tara:strand:- start:68 stop:400 length:333 start_codon:yes stop_codon:yes gene_type:complete
MDLRKYSITEFLEMQEDLIGSLVSLYSFEDEVGVCMSGKGIVTSLRREQGNVYARVFWAKTPFFNHIEKRKFGWHSAGRLFILQNKFGEKNYAISKYTQISHPRGNGQTT